MPTFRCSSFDDKDHIQSAEVIDAKALGDAIEKGLILPRRSRNPVPGDMGRRDKGVPGERPFRRCRLLNFKLRHHRPSLVGPGSRANASAGTAALTLVNRSTRSDTEMQPRNGERE